jgi:hypothetical protein
MWNNSGKMKAERYFEIEAAISKEFKMKLLAQITSGLLASGHFTCEANEPGDDYNFQLKVSCFELRPGKIEKAPTVIAAAERLLEEIIGSVYATEIYDEQEETSGDDPSALRGDP